MTAKRILLLMDNRADSNWGSQATTTELVRLLSAHHPGAEIRGLPRSVTRPNSALKRRLADATATSIAEWDLFETGPGLTILQWLSGGWQADIEWCDLIVVNGEGTLHPQKQTLRWMPTLKWLQRKSGKPIWVVNCSVQFVGASHESLYRSVLGAADRLVLRDPISKEECDVACICATLAADCAFSTEPSCTDQAGQVIQAATGGKPFAVFTGSASVKRWPLETQMRLISRVVNAGLRPIYSSSTAEDDLNYRRLKNAGVSLPIVTHNDLSFGEYCQLISQANILIGGRFHPLIFAAKVGTPFVAVESTTHKMKGLVRMLNCEEQLCEFDDADRQMGALDRAIAERKDRGASLAAIASVLSERTHLNATEALENGSQH